MNQYDCVFVPECGGRQSLRVFAKNRSTAMQVILKRYGVHTIILTCDYVTPLQPKPMSYFRRSKER